MGHRWKGLYKFAELELYKSRQEVVGAWPRVRGDGIGAARARSVWGVEMRVGNEFQFQGCFHRHVNSTFPKRTLLLTNMPFPWSSPFSRTKIKPIFLILIFSFLKTKSCQIDSS